MNGVFYNLLTDPLIRVASAGGRVVGSTLPGVLNRLSAGRDIVSFPALQPHQSHAWYSFLCQLAAIALRNAGQPRLVTEEDRWRSLLLRLTDGREEPWSLVVSDLSLPAFLQPPAPEGHLSQFNEPTSTPDSLDLLVTSKNHDVKSARMTQAVPEHWMLALVSLQTMQGYTGRHPPKRFYHGIARMNGGYGNRPCVAFVCALDWNSRFRRDVAILLRDRDNVLTSRGYRAAGGLALVWLKGWDGTTSLSLEALDPYFIEVCRRVRLRANGNRIEALTAASEVPRIAAKALNGNTGDPWTPVLRKEAKALTVGNSGFGYRLVSGLLFRGDFELGIAGRLQDDDPEEMWFLGIALSRGSGRTEGLHERILEIPGKVRPRLGPTENRKQLSAMAQARISTVDTVQRKVLRPALCALLQGRLRDLDMRDRRTGRWLRRLDDAVDAVFFEHMWADVDLEEEEAQRVWTDKVLELAEEELEHAMMSAPLPAGREFRARAAAERIFSSGRWRLTGSHTASEPEADSRVEETEG